MKTKSLFGLFLAVIIVIAFSVVFPGCASTPPVDPDFLVGTKWIDKNAMSGIPVTIAFFDHDSCLLRYDRIVASVDYKVEGSKIMIGSLSSYILSDDENALLFSDTRQIAYIREL